MELQFRKGRVLYRTPSSETEPGIFGNYYSIKSVAQLYQKRKDAVKETYKFKTKETLKLLDFSNMESFKFLDSKLKGDLHKGFQMFTGYGIKELHIYNTETKQDLCVYKNKAKYAIQLCPYTPQINSKEFGNKTISKELCKLGYDGYYMPEIYLDAQLSDDDLTYHKEYFICDPKKLERL
jgi:hypothetical protein